MVPAQTSSKTGTAFDCRRIGHLTPFKVQAVELVKNVKTQENNGENGWTRKQQQTTTLSETTSDDIDAIDTDMNARAGDAKLIPWLLVPDCAPQLSFCARLSLDHRKFDFSKDAEGVIKLTTPLGKSPACDVVRLCFVACVVVL